MRAVVVILSRAFVVFCCLPFHEFAHGWTANKLGDNTAKLQGRLTLNPIAHLNPIGTIMIFLFGIGYAKPVEINANNFKKPKRDMAISAIAGPCANVILAFIFVFIFYLLGAVLPTGNFTNLLLMFFYYAANINAVLAVFNILPIPPLDGSKVLAAVLPYKHYVKYMQYERYVMIALMILLFTGVLDNVISVFTTGLMNIISIIPRLIFGA
ncbi:MAG: site-2 protease family protein [Eubacterium sp.]|nr:site-2 protease family protein [Eubacterium sp.]